MRPLVIAMIAFSLLAQAAWGGQRLVCDDGSACPIPVDTATKPAPCHPPAPCEAPPVVPLKDCTLTDASSTDYSLPDAGVGEIHKPLFLSIAPITADVVPQQARFTEAYDTPPLRSAIPARIHAARAPPSMA